MNASPPSNFSWHNRRVFLTGHTGFKGGWLALWLASQGAIVRGYALDPYTTPNLFTDARIGSLIEDMRGDIRDPAALDAALTSFAPEVVFHLAAQPLVRASYADPILTFDTNVLGTARVLDAVRRTSSVRAVVSVTTDKCYLNDELQRPFTESDPLGGHDPYSASKACAEIVSAAYRDSFLAEAHCALATARAGNVIGGGDWSTDRLIPDLVRGFLSGSPVLIRHPHAVRPWQHVLEPLHGYLLLAEHLLGDNPTPFATAFNFGPPDSDAEPVSFIADHLAHAFGPTAAWQLDSAPTPHEAHYLRLDATRARTQLTWRPRFTLPTALDWTLDWYRSWHAGEDMQTFTLHQIAAYEQL
jgi:CDP-glucose 4,6-dehydratase